MTIKSILFVLLILFSGVIIAKDPCQCDRAKKFSKEQNELIEFLEATDLDYTETFTNDEVSEIVEASYYYCSNDHGYLYLKLQDKEKVYKDVPLNVWFEFKFNEEIESYYTSQIKYQYVPV